MSQILSALPIREYFLPQLRRQVDALRERGITPLLKIIVVGENRASAAYIKNKKRFAENINAQCDIERFPESINEEELLVQIQKEIEDKKVHGILVQLPLPQHLAQIDLSAIIPPEKDVDGFHYESLGKLLAHHKGDYMVPCTPMGIMTLLDFYKIAIEGKKVTVIGRSTIVGRPIAQLLINRNATVTICHSKTPDIKSYTKESDIIIVAIGREKFLTADYLSPHKKAVIIDVGINVNDKGDICGDVDFENIQDKVSAITPVPGGVGPLTILSLAQNLIKAAQHHLK